MRMVRDGVIKAEGGSVKRLAFEAIGAPRRLAPTSTCTVTYSTPSTSPGSAPRGAGRSAGSRDSSDVDGDRVVPGPESPDVQVVDAFDPGEPGMTCADGRDRTGAEARPRGARASRRAAGAATRRAGWPPRRSWRPGRPWTGPPKRMTSAATIAATAPSVSPSRCSHAPRRFRAWPSALRRSLLRRALVVVSRRDRRGSGSWSSGCPDRARGRARGSRAS